MTGNCVWTDLFGSKYAYHVHDLIEQPWLDIDGNYIFAKPSQNGWVALYIGEGNLKTRLTQNHEKWLSAVRLGATHILAHANQNSIARMQEEKRPIQTHNPPLNTQHRIA
jgi:hypothetical protein